MNFTVSFLHGYRSLLDHTPTTLIGVLGRIDFDAAETRPTWDSRRKVLTGSVRKLQKDAAASANALSSSSTVVSAKITTEANALSQRNVISPARN